MCTYHNFCSKTLNIGIHFSSFFLTTTHQNKHNNNNLTIHIKIKTTITLWPYCMVQRRTEDLYLYCSNQYSWYESLSVPWRKLTQDTRLVTRDTLNWYQLVVFDLVHFRILKYSLFRTPANVNRKMLLKHFCITISLNNLQSLWNYTCELYSRS